LTNFFQQKGADKKSQSGDEKPKHQSEEEESKGDDDAGSLGSTSEAMSGKDSPPKKQARRKEKAAAKEAKDKEESEEEAQVEGEDTPAPRRLRARKMREAASESEGSDHETTGKHSVYTEASAKAAKRRGRPAKSPSKSPEKKPVKPEREEDMRDAEAVSEEEQKEYEPTSEEDLDRFDAPLDDEDLPDDEFSPRKPKRAVKGGVEEPEEELDDTVFIDNLPKEENQIRVMLKEVNRHIRDLERKFFEEEDSEQDELQRQELMDEAVSIPEHNRRLEELKQRSHITQFFSIPLSDNVKSFDFERLAAQQQKHGGRLFDVISCDPPWQLSSANPTRGVAIAYDTLTNPQILDIPFHKIQESGYLLIWVINAKYRFAMEMFEENGYTLVDEVAWVKQTVNGKIAKGHGFYLQHAKETCLIGAKGDISKKGIFNIKSDVIFSQRRGQSQKPEEIYDLAEALVPNGYYLEIFGRRNNLHNGWCTIGNEL